MINNLNQSVQWLNQAKKVSRPSLNPTGNKVGALLIKDNEVVLTEYNHFPAGVKEETNPSSERWQGANKYRFLGHAEQALIAKAAKLGIQTDGATAAINWYPCAPCTRSLIDGGIKKLIGFLPNYQDPRWGDDFKASQTMLEEAGVETVLIKESDDFSRHYQNN